MSATQPAGPWPFAFFVGDFNTGKSTLINALLREPVLRADRQESHALPTFVWRGGRENPAFAALAPGEELHRKSISQFHGLRQDETNTQGYTAAAVLAPSCPFSRLVLVDTAGTSSDFGASRAPEFESTRGALMVVVTDIEYWSSKHNLDLIANYHDDFGASLLVVANKADHLNISEIERIHKNAAHRMEEYGISPAPRFFTLSARLETLRGDRDDEYRRRTKPTVRHHCDASFDAFRVALFEFESSVIAGEPAEELAVLKAPLAQAAIGTQEAGDAV
jgi:GTPase SAR1 family protein